MGIQKKKLLNEKTKLQTQLEIIKKKIESQIIKKWQENNLIDSIRQNNTLIEQLSTKKNIQEKKNNKIMRRIEDTIQIWRNKFGLIKVQNLSLMFKFINKFNVKNSIHIYDQWLSKSSNIFPFPNLNDFEKSMWLQYTYLNKKKIKLKAQIFKVRIDLKNLNNILKNIKQELNTEQNKILKLHKYDVNNDKKNYNLLRIKINNLINEEITNLGKIRQKSLKIVALNMEVKILQNEIDCLHDSSQKSLTKNDLLIIQDVKNTLKEIQTDNQILKLIADKMKENLRNFI